MPTTPTTGDTIASSVEEQFLDLICGDADLLQAEFDAIIAAEWPTPPANTPGNGAAGGHPVSRAARRAASVDDLVRFRRPGFGGWVRQRSPPAPTTTTDDRKGR